MINFLKKFSTAIYIVFAMILAICIFQGGIALLKYIGTIVIVFIGVKYLWKKVKNSE